MESGGAEDASLLRNLLWESIEQIAQLESAVEAPHRYMAQQIRNNIKNSIAKMYSEGSQQLSFTSNRALHLPSLNTDSPRSQKSEKVFKEHEHRAMCEKRKILDKYTGQVGVLQHGVDGSMDDGYSWKKYGQKDILGRHPRGYYRCTHRNTFKCYATKQVQRSDKNSNVFDITYKGKHTCMQTPKAAEVSPFNATATQQQQLLEKTFADKGTMHQHQDDQILLSFQTSLLAKTENSKAENEGHNSSFSFLTTAANNTFFPLDEHAFSLSSTPESNLFSSFPTFISPATSEFNFYPVSPSMSSYGEPPALHTSESELLNDVVSGTTSMTNPPMVGGSIMLDFGEFDPSFPFDSNLFQLNEQNPV